MGHGGKRGSGGSGAGRKKKGGALKPPPPVPQLSDIPRPKPFTELEFIPIPGISEDPEDHDGRCPYSLWRVSHYKSLLTDEEVEEDLYTTTLKKTRGQNYPEVQKNIRAYAKAMVSSGHIRNYLDGSREMWNVYRRAQMRRCQCPQGRIGEGPSPEDLDYPVTILPEIQSPPADDSGDAGCSGGMGGRSILEDDLNLSETDEEN